MAIGVLCDMIDEIMKWVSHAVSPAAATADSAELPSNVKDPLGTLQGHLRQIRPNVVEAEKNQTHSEEVKAWLGEVNDVVNEMRDLEEDLYPLREKPGRSRKKKTSIFSTTPGSSAQRSVLDKIKKIETLMKAVENGSSELNLSDDKGSTSEPSDHHDQLKLDHKLCLAYCSLLPEDYEIDVQRLINLWMAEGFLRPSPDSSPEDVGFQYVTQFDQQSYLQVKKDDCEKPRTCKMIRCQMPHIQTFDSLSISNMEQHEETVPEGRLRRVSFHYSLDVSYGIPDFLFNEAEKLWTILLPSAPQPRLPDEVKLSASTCEKIFSTFKRLHVLDLHDLGMKVVPGSINEMKYLKFLDLSENDIEKLPSSVAKLHNLQTLKLSYCQQLKELPKDLDDLTSLRHLLIEGCISLTHMPSGIGKLTSLRTLSNFVASKSSSSTAGLDELANLKELRGELEILHLERVRFDDSANPLPTKKEHLSRLTLRWDHDDQKDESKAGEDEDDKLLERLQPHAKLQVLFIVGYKGSKFPDWLSNLKIMDDKLSSLDGLVNLSLYNCPSCKSIAPVHLLKNLKSLKLQSMDSLEYVAHGYVQTTPFFPSLKELTLSDCPKLRRWREKEDENETVAPSFLCISRLEVQYCPKLQSMPPFPLLDEKLVLVSSSMEPLKAMINAYDKKTENTAALTTSSTEVEVAEPHAFSPFSKLKSMVVASLLHKTAPPEWLKFFTSLEDLHIRECHGLKSLPTGFSELCSLKTLKIENCVELELSSKEWEGLGNLHKLTLIRIPKLEILPPRLQHLTSLKELRLDSCPELTSLLEQGIEKLTSLETLVISECHKLASLPEGMAQLESLKRLEIRDCSKLFPRCQSETGEDWPKIAHIKERILVK